MARYGTVKSLTDITKINQKIRSQVRTAKSDRALAELYRQSMYLITLTYSSSWRNIENIAGIRTRAKSEFSKTARLINVKFRKLGIKKKYDTKWK